MNRGLYDEVRAKWRSKTRYYILSFMTGRTHDVAAFAFLSYGFISFNPPSMTLATLIAGLGAGLIGGLYPDLDKASGDLWKKIPGGSLVGKLLAPLMGGHRMISHSIVGYVLTGFLLSKFLILLKGIVLVDMLVVWYGFMIGYLSHLVADGLTKEGVPLLFPIPLAIGIPPLKALRITTGGWAERYLVYPGLILGIGYFYYAHYGFVLNYFQHQLR